MKLKLVWIFIAAVLVVIWGCQKSEYYTQDVLENDHIKIQLVTPKIVNAIAKGEEDQAYLIIENKASEAMAFVLNFSVVDFSYDTLQYQTLMNLKSNQVKLLNFEKTVFSKLGIKWIDLIARYDEKEASAKFSLAYMNPTLNKYQSDFKFGVAGLRFDNNEQLDWQLNAMAQIGVQYNRRYVYWDEVQPDSLTWNWSSLDNILEHEKNFGIQRQLLVSGSAPWAIKSNYPNAKSKKRVPPRIEPWKRYITALATRYQNDIRYYEIWNEPDFGFWIGNTPEYVETLKGAYEAIKSVNPDLNVMTGGFAHVQVRSEFFKVRGDLHKDAIRLGQDYFDIHAVHIHGSYDRYKPYVDGKFADIRKQLKTEKPVWFNETGMHSTQIGDKEQGKAVFQKITLAMARDAMGYCWFAPKDNDKFPIDDHEANYGMIYSNNNPKSAYLIYNQVIQQMKNQEYVQDLDLGVGLEAFMFKSSDSYLINAWKQEKYTPEQLICFKVSKGTRVVVTDLMGNEKEYPVVQHKVVVPVKTDGAFIHFLNCSEKPELQKSYLGLNEKVFSNGKDEVEIASVIAEDMPAADLITLNDENGELLASAKGHDISLKAQTKAESVILKVKTEKLGLDESLNINVTRPLIVPNITQNKKEADIVLNTYDKVFNKYENDPNTIHMVWKGEKDLSAKCWINIDKENLNFRFEITDDIHVQDQLGKTQFKGDGVQMAIRTTEMMGVWNLGAAFDESGRNSFQGWDAPEGYDWSTYQKVKLTTQRMDDKSIYNIQIPLADFGLEKIEKEGFYFSFMVNDNDTGLREGYMQYTEGMGGAPDYSKYKYILFK